MSDKSENMNWLGKRVISLYLHINIFWQWERYKGKGQHLNYRVEGNIWTTSIDNCKIWGEQQEKKLVTQSKAMKQMKDKNRNAICGKENAQGQKEDEREIEIKKLEKQKVRGGNTTEKNRLVDEWQQPNYWCKICDMMLEDCGSQGWICGWASPHYIPQVSPPILSFLILLNPLPSHCPYPTTYIYIHMCIFVVFLFSLSLSLSLLPSLPLCLNLCLPLFLHGSFLLCLNLCFHLFLHVCVVSFVCFLMCLFVLAVVCCLLSVLPSVYLMVWPSMLSK